MADALARRDVGVASGFSVSEAVKAERSKLRGLRCILPPILSERSRSSFGRCNLVRGVTSPREVEFLSDVPELAVKHSDLTIIATQPDGGYAATWRNLKFLVSALREQDGKRWLHASVSRFDRHTALGDARWAKALYEAVIGAL